jgi:hypothetical protein
MPGTPNSISGTKQLQLRPLASHYAVDALDVGCSWQLLR